MKRKFLLIGLVLLLASLIIGCPAQVVEEPVVEEPPIPAYFTTYTDEANLFSISYPAEWELILWACDDEDIEQFTKEVIESIEFGLPLERASALLMAMAVITEIGAGVTIWVEPLPGVGWTLDEAVEASVQEGKDLFGEDYHEFSRVKTTIDGREAVIVESGVGEWSFLEMITLVDETVWTVSCTPDVGKDDAYAIVRSFRILK